MSSYIGRFAPSPSGSLHFGSLVAALGSYLRARSQLGRWLVRIEDIDPPREIPGAVDNILRTLEQFGLHWDGEVLYQSARLSAYQQQINHLLAEDQAYFCQCSRKQIKQMGGTYDGRCGRLQPPLSSGAIRIHNQSAIESFYDVLMGNVITSTNFAAEDFILKRSDGLYAYQLVVVLDDAFQGITEVVRGADLLEATVRQISLYRQFGLPEPGWLHLPLASLEPGFKLSKQNHATPVDGNQPQPALQAALAFLGQAQVEWHQDIRLMIEQAVTQFDLHRVPGQREILLTD
ncbi:MAG: tRNA glutamyl-Q(34) synthetase GluQRS [Shewanella sp.]|nr:tRNA glutamyl-Q(34) synthetase GluQRS [Shewanella sp.]MCF1457356.1 tRNA glutamyl-Q(34) synthetase GluQRS [Shewanella sp.]